MLTNLPELQRILVMVQDVGVAHVRKQELLSLLGRKRLTSSVWVDVLEIWEDVSNGKNPLLVCESDGVWAFVNGDGLKVAKGSKFQDVTTMIPE